MQFDRMPNSTLAVLLVGSSVVLLVESVALLCPTGGCASWLRRARMWMVMTSRGAIEPITTTTLRPSIETVPRVVVTSTTSRYSGSESLTTTSSAAIVPSLGTVIVKSSMLPMHASPGTTLLSIRGSA